MLPVRQFASTRTARFVKLNSVAEGEIVAEGRYVRKENSVKYPDRWARVLRMDSGEDVGVSGCSSLDSGFENVALGDYVRIIYRGERTSKGQHAGSRFYVCDVLREVVQEDVPVAVAEAEAAPSLD